MLLHQKSLEKEIEKMKSKAASAATDAIDSDLKMLNGISVLVKKVTAETPSVMRELADKFRDKIKSGIVVLGSTAESKVLLIAVVTKDLTSRYHAGNIVKHVSSIVGGSGGGRPDMAQAGGNRPEKLDEALAKASDLIGSL